MGFFNLWFAQYCIILKAVGQFQPFAFSPKILDFSLSLTEHSRFSKSTQLYDCSTVSYLPITLNKKCNLVILQLGFPVQGTWPSKGSQAMTRSLPPNPPPVATCKVPGCIPAEWKGSQRGLSSCGQCWELLFLWHEHLNRRTLLIQGLGFGAFFVSTMSHDTFVCSFELLYAF